MAFVRLTMEKNDDALARLLAYSLNSYLLIFRAHRNVKPGCPVYMITSLTHLAWQNMGEVIDIGARSEAESSLHARSPNQIGLKHCVDSCPPN